MVVLMIFGIICLVLGALFLIGKENMEKLENLLNKTILKNNKHLAYKYNKILGFVLALLAVTLIYISLTLNK